MFLAFYPKHWFGEVVRFDCRGRKGKGVIEIINLSQHNEISYEILVDDEPYDIQGTVFENEIVTSDSDKICFHQVQIQSRFSFRQHVSFFKAQQLVKGNVYGISIDEKLKCYYEVHIEDTNIHQPMVSETEILLPEGMI